MRTSNYVNVVLILLKSIFVVYILYMIIVLFLNVFLKETSGEILFYNKYQEKVIDAPARFEGGIRNRGYIERDIWKIDLNYKYTVDDNIYLNSRISNVLIYPDIELISGKTITIYYNRIIPKYSLLYKCDYIYFLINILPIIIIFVIILLIQKYTIKKCRNKKNRRKHNGT